MEMKDFFSFGSKLLSSTLHARPIGLRPDKNGVNGHVNLIKGKYQEIEFPIVFKQDRGNILTDMLDTGHAGLYLISDRMKLVLEENHITGWKVFSIKLYDKKNNEIPGYYGFSTTGCCGPISYGKSEIIERRLVPEGPLCKCYKGLYLGLDQWDGSDVFIPDKTHGIFITQRAAEVLKKNKITNVRLENLAEIETDVN